MKTSHERATKALEFLTMGLVPVVERELKAVYQDEWLGAARGSFRNDRGPTMPAGEVIRWDAHAILTVMWDQWNAVFRHKLGQPDRSLISELREFRNRWAHQEPFDFDDTYRIMDSVQRLLTAVSAAEAKQVGRAKRELLREEFRQEVKAATAGKESSSGKWSVVVLCFVCNAIVVFLLISEFGKLGVPTFVLAFFVTFFFMYLIYKRLVRQTADFGPHECEHCGKIIYTVACPYCERAAT